MNLRTAITSISLLKLITFLSFLNIALTFVSLLSSKNQSSSQTQDVDLAKFPDETFGYDVVLGAPLIHLDSDTLAKISSDSGKTGLKIGEIIPSDIFYSIRTTGKFHQTRLKILLDTWIHAAPSAYIFTENEHQWLDSYIEKKFSIDYKPSVIATDCPLTSGHKWALLCKMHWEYRTFLSTSKHWFCHFDDDLYVNVPLLVKVLNHYSYRDQVYIGRSPSEKQTMILAYDTANIQPEVFEMGNSTFNDTTWEAPVREVTYKRVAFHYALGGSGFCISRELAMNMREFALGSKLIHSASSIALPDDCVIGYIITYKMNVSLISLNLMRHHLEDLSAIPESDLLQQVTISQSVCFDPGKQNCDMANKENSRFFNHSAKAGSEDYNNIISLLGPYSPSHDPTRFLSLHKIIMENQIRNN